jgi:PAP2 superfamily
LVVSRFTRRLPGATDVRAWTELARYAVLFLVFTLAYKTARWLAEPESSSAAFDNADRLIALERSSGSLIEPRVQSLTEAGGLEPVTTWLYTAVHQPGYIAFFIGLWFLGRDIFPFVWRWFWVTSAMAVLGFWLFPLAPPRLVPELGLADPTHTTLELGGTTTWFMDSDFRNIYAAMPSLHVGYPILFACVIFCALKPRPWRWLAWIWPLAMSWAVLASANHFWLDIAGGALVVAAGGGVTALLWSDLRRPWTDTANEDRRVTTPNREPAIRERGGLWG